MLLCDSWVRSLLLLVLTGVTLDLHAADTDVYPCIAKMVDQSRPNDASALRILGRIKSFSLPQDFVCSTVTSDGSATSADNAVLIVLVAAAAEAPRKINDVRWQKRHDGYVLEFTTAAGEKAMMTWYWKGNRFSQLHIGRHGPAIMHPKDMIELLSEHVKSFAPTK